MNTKYKTKKIQEIIWARLSEITSGRGTFKMKEDGSYVSEGDLLVQSIVQDWVNEAFPKHQLISEEQAPFSDTWNSSGSYVVLDPIDGTENFISGLKEWGVGLSIYTNGKHEASCILLPEINDYQITGMPIKKYQPA